MKKELWKHFELNDFAARLMSADAAPLGFSHVGDFSKEAEISLEPIDSLLHVGEIACELVLYKVCLVHISPFKRKYVITISFL